MSAGSSLESEQHKSRGWLSSHYSRRCSLWPGDSADQRGFRGWSDRSASGALERARGACIALLLAVCFVLRLLVAFVALISCRSA